MENHQLNSSNRRIALGAFLIVIGGIWILERMNLIPASLVDVLISWQMLLVGIGVFSLFGGHKTAGIILISVGLFFLIPEIVDIPYEIRRIGWPLIIVGVGVVLLLSQTKIRSKEPPIAGSNSDGKGVNNYFDDFVIFGGREVYIDSLDFVGGKSTSIFGGTVYDFRQAKLSQNGAVVDCLTLFGGCEFKIPPDWTVKNEVTAIFGGFSDKRGASTNQIIPDSSKTLVIKGFAAFGGVEVKYI